MANTLKFGNENWATKKDSILAYNDENANFKPLPFATSRASTATRVNKLGLIEKVAVGIPRVDYLGNTKGALLLEPQSRNLISRSEAFASSYWTKSGASIEGDASTAGVEKVVNGDFASDSNWTKGAGTTISGGSANFSSATAVSLYQSVSATVNSLVTFNVTNYVSGVLNVYLGGSESVSTQNVSANGNGNYTVLLDFNTGNGNIIFGSSNSFTGSIDNVSIKEVSGFASPSADSPLGAFKLVEDTSNGQHYVEVSSMTISNNTKHTQSFYVKYNGSQFIRIFASALNAYTYFDVLNGAIGSTTAESNSIKLLSNGWFRCSITDESISTSTTFKISLAESDGDVQYTGNGTSGVYIFGAQLEQKSYATSYIKTSGSQITRLSDTASQTVPDGVIGQTVGGVVYMDFIAQNSEGLSQSHFWMGSAGSEIGVYGSNPLIFYSSGGVSIQGANLVTGERYKIALAFETNDYAAYVNGVQIGVDLSATYPNMSSIYLNSYNNGTEIQKKKINDFRLYNTRLSNSELATLTTI